MTKEQMIRFFLVLVVGWMLGYFHHFQATRPEVVRLALENAAMTERVRELEARADDINKVWVKTTAYSSDEASINVARWREDGMTATSTPARRGIVAADWRVFPPGTQLYIPGYGEAVVEDRGGAVKGYHLDLYVESYEEARAWGVREVGVYVIRKGARSQS